MVSTHPSCPVCAGKMHIHGKTTTGKTRYRCNKCNLTHTKNRPDITNTVWFKHFITYCTGKNTLADIADNNEVSLSTVRRRFRSFWLVQPPHPTVDRIYDQVFLDGTYMAGGCLLIAATWDHVINWHWCKHENTDSYIRLIENIPAPLMVVIDGGQGAQKAVKTCWPTTIIQRCIIHAARRVRIYTTTKPNTIAGKSIYQLSKQLMNIKTIEDATRWLLLLQEYGTTYQSWLKQKSTYTRANGTTYKDFTHRRVRRAYTSLLTLVRKKMLFNYLQPPPEASEPHRFTGNTNRLEGKFNAELKKLARAHPGLKRDHQRTIMDWWCYLHTELPGDPLQVARQQNWGHTALGKAQRVAQGHIQADQKIGPDLYGQDIDFLNYEHSLGVRKGHVG